MTANISLRMKIDGGENEFKENPPSLAAALSVGGSPFRHAAPGRKGSCGRRGGSLRGKVRFVSPHNRGDYATRWPSLWDVIISAFAHLPPSQSPSTFPVSSHKRYVMPPLEPCPSSILPREELSPCGFSPLS